MFQCKTCKIVIRSRRAYTAHMWATKSLQCPDCAEKYSNLCGLLAHRMNSHFPLNRRLQEVEEQTQINMPAASYRSTERPEAASAFPIDTIKDSSSTAAEMSTPSPKEISSNGFKEDVPRPETRSNSPNEAMTTVSNVMLKTSSNTPSNTPMGELLDLGVDPPTNEIDKLQDAIQAFQNLVADKRYRVDRSDDNQVKPEVSESTTEPAIETAEFPRAESESSSKSVQTKGDSWEVVDKSEPSPTHTHPVSHTSGIVCFECEAGFATIIGLHHHQMITNHNYCQGCHAFFADRSLFHKHKEEIHSFRCASCSSKFNSWGALVAHNQATDHCFCKDCQCYFLDDANHKKHMSTYHTTSRCPVCCRGFLTAPDLQSHQKSSGHCYCEQCDKTMVNQANMQMHVTLVHIHKCGTNNCKFAGRTPEDLKIHQQRANHNYCIACSRAFCDSQALVSHQRSEKHIKKVKEFKRL